MQVIYITGIVLELPKLDINFCNWHWDICDICDSWQKTPIKWPPTKLNHKVFPQQKHSYFTPPLDSNTNTKEREKEITFQNFKNRKKQSINSQ